MVMVGSALKGYVVEADDGSIGSVHDCLFDRRIWKLRWLAVDTGGWLTGREVQIHPSAVGRPEIGRLCVPVHLTKAQIKASPDISFDLPISEQMEKGVCGYLGWDPEWGAGGYFAGYPESAYGEAQVLDRPGSENQTGLGGGDLNLHSVAAVKGYHNKDFIIDDVS